MDTTDSLIQFDESGVCDHCNNFYNNIKPHWPFKNSSKNILYKQIEKIKKDKPKNSKYDCLIGIVVELIALIWYTMLKKY